VIGKVGRARAGMMARHPIQTVKSWLHDGFFRKLVRNSGWLMGSQALVAVIGLATMAVKTRGLGAEGFGFFTLIFAFSGIVGSLCAFQSWQALIKFGAASLQNNNKAQFSGYVKMAFALDVAGAWLGAVVAVSGAFFLSERMGWDGNVRAMMIVAGAALVFNTTGAATAILRLFDRFRWITYQQGATALLGFLTAGAAYFAGYGPQGFVIAAAFTMAVGNLTLLFMGLLVLHRDGYRVHASAPLTNKREFFRFSGWTYLSSTVDIPVKQLDVVLASSLISVEAAGIYKLIKQVAQVLNYFTDAVYRAVYPQFAALIAGGELKLAIRHAAKIGAIIAAVISPVSLTAAATAYWWLPGFFGADFRVGWAVMALFLLLKILTLPWVPNGPLFMALGFAKQNMWILLVANSVYLLAAWLLGQHIGLAGFVMAWFVQAYTVIIFKVSLIWRARARL
jgi:O-antigen/teichoic acid export membrane protein